MEQHGNYRVLDKMLGNYRFLLIKHLNYRVVSYFIVTVIPFVIPPPKNSIFGLF